MLVINTTGSLFLRVQLHLLGSTLILLWASYDVSDFIESSRLSSQYMPVYEVREQPRENPVKRASSVTNNRDATVLLLVMCSQISDLAWKVSKRRSNTGDSLRQRLFFRTPVSHHYRRALFGEPLGLLQHVCLFSVLAALELNRLPLWTVWREECA